MKRKKHETPDPESLKEARQREAERVLLHNAAIDRLTEAEKHRLAEEWLR